MSANPLQIPKGQSISILSFLLSFSSCPIFIHTSKTLLMKSRIKDNIYNKTEEQGLSEVVPPRPEKCFLLVLACKHRQMQADVNYSILIGSSRVLRHIKKILFGAFSCGIEMSGRESHGRHAQTSQLSTSGSVAVAMFNCYHKIMKPLTRWSPINWKRLAVVEYHGECVN